MRIIETKVYTFNELSENAKQNAIENIRNNYYEYNDFEAWAIDDCALLEPLDKEMKQFGKDYKFPLIENNRKIYFSLDRNRNIDISNAMQIQNSTQFLTWLGLDKRLIDKVDYTIGKDTIEFFNQGNTEFTHKQEDKLDKAVEKFEDHCNDILNRIETAIDYRFSDEAIIEDIAANDFEFTEDGNKI